MLEKLLNLIRSEEDQDPSFIRLTRNILIFVMVVTFAVIPLVTGIAGSPQNRLAFTSLSILLVLEAASFYFIDRKSTRLNSSHVKRSRMPSSA